ncbi:unnamed protein product [Rhizophagus irregularis]|uniref:Trimethylguanosine synthase n=1 Tax=Rhizophagus irregularis TaxID=588596 RepID=A0A2I1FU90_9GLOM|nr:S-adenosyl-L-methionine-dependent methyltransferase [Rhizophagus irregularis]CAB4405483.1 unnamed protein product [Rhizophagus irregularis]
MTTKKRRRRRKSSTNNVQHVEEPATKKPRLNSQEEDPTSQLCTKAQVELTSNSKGIINDTRVLEISGQESFHLGSHFDTQTVSDRVKATTVSSSLYTNGNTRSHSAKKYTITEKDLIYLAQIKENKIDENKRTSGRPVITFSISDNNLTNLELIQSKENGEITENFSKEQIDNLKGNGQVENSRFEDSVIEIIPENIKIENESSIQIGNNEVNEVNGGIESKTGCVENFKEHDQIIQNSYIENSDEHEDSINNEHFEISKKDNSLSKQFLRHTNSKHLRPGLEKYWHQRYLFFSLYDEGIMMDEEGWYSVTPEYLAAYIAKRCACDTIIDAMCGVGGNAIQFAMTCKKVIAIDIDETKLYCAKNNARIYGVEDKIEFILGDFYNLVPRLKADVVFLSPPWGGPSYRRSKVYDIKTMISVDGERLFRESSKITKNIVYYVPKSINFNQMQMLCEPDKICEFQKVIVWDKPKSYLVYYGDLVGNYFSEVIKLPRYWVNDTSADYNQSEETEY